MSLVREYLNYILHAATHALKMKFLAAMLLLVLGCNSHDVQDDIKSRDNVFFTGYNEALTADDLQFAPADPSKQTTNGDGTFNTIVYTHERDQIQYWGMTASYDEKKIWANDVRSSQLKQIDLGSSSGVTLTFDLTRGLENLAYDRITKVLYWTDSTDKAIRAIELTFRHFTEVYRSEVAPYALTVHPVKRKLFFSVYKTDNNFISDTELIKSDLDGGNQRAILRFPDVIRPRGITIDFSSDFLYWTDYNFLRQATIMKCDLNGGRKKQFFAKSRSYLWGIAYYKGYIYATDIVNTTDNKYEIEIRKTTGRESYTRKLTTRSRNVAIYGPDETATTKVTNECRKSRCEHICLSRGNGGFVCKCSPGFTLMKGYKCVSDELDDDYILVADIGQKRLFQLPIGISASSVRELVAVDLDDVTNYRIYAASAIKKTGGLAWYDIGAKEIVWEKRRISELEGVYSITTGCCNERVYWNTKKRIYSWDGISAKPEQLLSYRSSSNAQIRQVVVDCKANRFYWVTYDTNYKKSFVIRSDLKGRDSETVLFRLPESYSLTIDYERNPICTTTTRSMLDVVFLIDGSGSIGPNDFQQVKQWILQVVDQLRPSLVGAMMKLRIVIVQYSANVRIELEQTIQASSDEIKVAVEAIKQMDSSTNTYGALRFINSDVVPKTRSGSVKILISITDGQASDNRDADAINEARSNFDVMLAIGIGDQVNGDQLEDLSHKTEPIIINSFTSIGNITESVVQVSCVPASSKRKPIGYTLHVLTAFEGAVYSIPLKDLETSIPSTSPNHRGYIRTELKPYMNNERVMLVGIAVVDGYAYIADDENDAIFRFNWKRGASSMERYGGNQVFYPTAMDFYSERYYEKYLRPICEPRIGSGQPTTTTSAPTTTAGTYCSRKYYKDISEGMDRNIAYNLYFSCVNMSINMANSISFLSSFVGL